MATNDFAVVVLSRFPDILAPLLSSIEQFEKPIPRLIVVQDRSEWDLPSWCERIVVHADSFCFSRNANIAMIHAATSDIVLLNDDCRLIQLNTFQSLADHANAVPTFGIVSPKVKGGTANPYQRVGGPWPYGAQWVELRGRKPTDPYVPFVCSYLKRRMIQELGPLDERFVSYGEEDRDYCLRAKRAAWKVVIFRDPILMHGDGGAGLELGRNCHLSFSRDKERKSNWPIFAEKYGLNHEKQNA